jgi:type IV pilus assembly protein PilY1
MNEATSHYRAQPAEHEPRSRKTLARVSGLGAILAVLAYAAPGAAQADVNPQMPNVLLLVDTSGSMEYLTSASTFPVCRYNATGLIPAPPTTSDKSRWTDLIEVLTGSITNYDCQTIDRGSAAFQAEYKVNSTLANSPYDFLYSNPYHRPMSGGCVAGPGTLNPLNAADFPSTSFNYHQYNNVNQSCTYNQSPDGILDAFQSGIRFGLMTFDTDPSPDQGELGTYSYVVGKSHVGLPTGCTTPSPMEVGSRNASAPPWEGRLIPFGDPSPGSLDYQTKNQQIQQVLRASRPYGATPIAGMLSDARDFLWNDTSFDLVNTSQPFGPSSDPYGSCRDTVLLLMSDGQPNMDLRGHCTGTDCPFQLPEDIAADLLSGSVHKAVKTFVIGFALNTLTVAGQGIDCSLLKPADLNATPGSLCAANPDNASLQACCNLARIAEQGDVASADNGNNPHAFFANDRDELRSDISTVLSRTFPTTSRTQAVFSPTPAGAVGGTFAASYRFFSNFTPVLFEPWSGQVERERWICDKDTHQPSRVDPDPNFGDLFADNMNSQQGRARTFYTVQATDAGSGVFSDRTIRPNMTTNPDGVGSLTGTFSAGDSQTTFVGNTSPASMGLTDTSCTQVINNITTPMTASQCRDRYMKWLVGLDNGTVYDRCVGGTCNLLGDIFHSTPRVVGPPTAFTLDDTYTAYQAAYSTRPLMLYTSSNDGFLHAFKVQSNVPGDTENIQTKKNNELWAFIPPQVLPHIPAEYPFTHQVLLDGVPVVKDVVARKGTGSYPYVFERSTSDIAGGVSPNATWRTILIQSFGSIFPGYFALDVTNPDPTMTLNTESGGPKFLWQITSDQSGNPLFGNGGGTPIITSLLFDDDGNGVREVAVAILPGGPGDPGSFPAPLGGCQRASSTTDEAKLAYAPRTVVPCHTLALGARSLTVVRLDTGKIVRTFRRAKTEVPAAMQARVIVSPLDSPITGEPVAYPSDIGAIADRVYVGDQDGALWKADLSNSSPDNWTMSLFWDAFPNVTINGLAPAGATGGQPIQTAPVLSLDTSNNVTLAIATGDQNSLGAAPGQANYLWSLKDAVDPHTDLQWGQQFLNGERVTGPISLFNSYLYFSSVTPPAGNTPCTSTSGAKIWGMNYVIPRDGPGTPLLPSSQTVGGLAAPFILADFGSTAQFVTDTTLLGTSAQNQAVIFGVSVAQVPTCFDISDVPTDAYLGGHTQISNINPGKTQLVFQTGAGKLGTGGKANVSTDGTGSIDLPPLSTPSHIDAWASIVE